MNNLLKLLVTLNVLTSPLMATETNLPLLDKTMTCIGETIEFKVKIISKDMNNKKGLVLAFNDQFMAHGNWNLLAAPEGTRLTGSYFLNLKAIDNENNVQIDMATIYNPIFSNISGPILIDGQTQNIECDF